MRMPRLRIRTVMIVVAIVAPVLAAGIEVRRLYGLARYYRQRAVAAAVLRNEYARRVKWKRGVIASREPGWEFEQERKFLLTVIQKEDGRRRYYSTLSSRYDHAARYPWLPIEPDPPAPD